MPKTKTPKVFDRNVKRTNRYHPDLLEYGIGCQTPPEVLKDPKRFHLACEVMRLAMLDSLEKRGPINLWRIGQLRVSLDEKDQRYLLLLRTRAARTLRPEWVNQNPHMVVDLPSKPEGGAYTIIET
jgi:hypothetical protein